MGPYEMLSRPERSGRDSSQFNALKLGLWKKSSFNRFQFLPYASTYKVV